MARELSVKNREQVAAWVQAHPLQDQQVDCAVAVMLKILDGKCKMRGEEKVVMRHLYHAVKHRPMSLLDPGLHPMIARAETCSDEALREHIYEHRVLAETMISRPVMKAFKRTIRERGLFEHNDQ